MKICPRCRQYCADQKIACPKCGASLDTPSDSPVQGSAYGTIIADLCKTLESNPTDDGIRRTLIEKYRAQRDWENVAAHLQILAEADPENLVVKEDLYQAWRAAGRAGEAALILKAMIDLQPGDIARRERMHDLMAGIDLDSVSEGQRRALARCWVECGDASCKTGEIDKAAAFYLKAYQASAESAAGRRLADLHAGWAVEHEKAREYAQAIEALSAAVTYAPDDVSLQNRLRKTQRVQNRRRLLRWCACGAVVIISLAGFLFCFGYQSMLDVRVVPSERSAWRLPQSSLIYDGRGAPQFRSDPFRFHWLRRSETVWQADGEQFVTPVLPGGPYRLIVEKLGDKSAEKRVLLGFGRKTKITEVVLVQDPIMRGGPTENNVRRSTIRTKPGPGGKLRMESLDGRIVGFTDDLTSACFAVVLDRLFEGFRPEYTSEASCLLRFVVRRNGANGDIQIIESSGVEMLDRLAVQAVRNAVMPPLDDSVRPDAVPIFAFFRSPKENDSPGIP